MTNSLASIAPRLAKLLPLLGSDKDGEVIAAARAIQRALSGNRLDFHDLVAALTASNRSAELSGPPNLIPLWEELDPPRRNILLGRILSWDGLTDFELNFCSQIRAAQYRRPPSPKQIGVLNQIVVKAWREGIRA